MKRLKRFDKHQFCFVFINKENFADVNIRFVYVWFINDASVVLIIGIWRRLIRWIVNVDSKGYGRKLSWTSLGFSSGICQDWMKQTKRNFKIVFLRAEIWTEDSENKAEVLTIRLQHSVSRLYLRIHFKKHEYQQEFISLVVTDAGLEDLLGSHTWGNIRLLVEKIYGNMHCELH
jgi:hypothetical protein